MPPLNIMRSILQQGRFETLESIRAEGKYLFPQDGVVCLSDASEMNFGKRYQEVALARELHDNIQQRLAFVRYALERLALSGDEIASADLKPSMKEIVQISQEISDIVGDKHETDTELMNVSEMIRETISVWSCLISCKFVADFPVKLILRTTDVRQIYRIVQEAARNAVVHGQADEVIVSHRKEKAQNSLVIKDNGHGFDTALVAEGVGLGSMRMRASALNGSLEVKSRPGYGTTVEIVFPVK